MTTTITTDTPRIYVASLADYNAGRLHGRWIDADQDADDIKAKVDAMLAESKETCAEEWAIHDFDMGGIQINEWDSFEHVAAIGEILTDPAIDAEAFAAWFNYETRTGEPSDWLDAFHEEYMGEFDSDTDMAYEWLETTGDLSMIPDFIVNYIDFESYARELDTWNVGRYYFRSW